MQAVPDVSKQHLPRVKWELRMRFLTAFIWVLAIGAMRNHLVIVFCAGIAVVAMLIMGIPLLRIIKRILIISPFLLLSFFTLLISDGFPITGEALSFASLIAVRIIASIFVITLVTVDEIKQYLSAFKAIRMPDALTSTMFLTQRYVHLIGHQLSSVRKALVSRLFAPKMRLRTMKIYGQITGGVTVRAIDRSKQVQQAMFSRGFAGQMWAEKPAAILGTDIVKVILSVLVIAALLVLDRGVLA